MALSDEPTMSHQIAFASFWYEGSVTLGVESRPFRLAGLYDKVGRMGDYASDLDAWTAQVYRGSTFGDFFDAFGNNTDKPILLTEYGVDAYHDVCGARERSQSATDRQTERRRAAPCARALERESARARARHHRRSPSAPAAAPCHTVPHRAPSSSV